MKPFSFSQPRTSNGLLSRLVWWTAILLSGTILFGAALVHLTAWWGNKQAAVNEHFRINSAIMQRAEFLGKTLEGIVRAIGEEAPHEKLSAFAEPHFDFVGVGSLDKRGDIVSWLFLRAKPELADGASSNFGDIIPKRKGDLHNSVFLAIDGALTVRAAVRLSDDRVLVGLHRLAHEELRLIAELTAISDFAMIRGEIPEGRNGVSLVDVVTGEPISLTWSGSRPGDYMRNMVASAAAAPVALTFILFALVVVNTRRIARDLAASQARAESLAGRDPLSGLPNRLLFSDRLDQELAALKRQEEGLALMFLDLDRFKEVNDTYGHQAGDELIKQVARRLLTVLRGADTLSRFGGDEFAIIQTGVKSDEDAEALARRILLALTDPFDLGGTPVNIGVSIGIAMAPRHAMDRESLMRLADTALYEAKSEGRNRYSFFLQQMDEAIRMRKVVADDLREAIASDQLTVHYQPIYSSTGDRIVSLEALVRWPHPSQGMIPPAKFIPLAEQSGLVIPLGEWVLRRVCRDGHRWPGVRIAVNVSPIQFRQRDFVQDVLDIVQKANFDPARLELELTEGVVVEDADAAEAAMMRLRAHGFHLALDDFGSGYSSLIYLRRFAFDKIKIDRSFLESMEATGESAILVHSIVHLGRALGLTVTAEGVETKEQHRFLQALGCHELQGYLFSKPLSASEIDALLGVEVHERSRVSAA